MQARAAKLVAFMFVTGERRASRISRRPTRGAEGGRVGGMTFNKAATKTADFKKRILARAWRPIAEELAKRNALGVNRRARTARAWPGALPDRRGN